MDTLTAINLVRKLLMEMHLEWAQNWLILNLFVSKAEILCSSKLHIGKLIFFYG